MEFIPYKSNETLENRYYQIPQELFENSLYKYSLSLESKILYGFILDRLSLSNKNHWIDENNSIYLIFTRKEVEDKLCLSGKTVIKAFKQLNKVKLISEKRQGLGKPNLIYVGKIHHEPITEVENIQFQNCKNSSSEIVKNSVQEQENLQGINPNNIKTNIINTDSINPNSNNDLTLNVIKEKCQLNTFPKDEKAILEDVIDTLYYKDTLKVGSIIVNHYKILDKLQLIVKENLIQLIDILKNIPNIQNIKSYLMICLYNNLGNPNLIRIKDKNKFSNYNQRTYDNLDYLYANKFQELYEN